MSTYRLTVHAGGREISQGTGWLVRENLVVTAFHVVGQQALRLSALAPYITAGEIKDERMFFGREHLLRELLTASSLPHLIVGPRRVGKTSLLKRLARLFG